ncbi:Oxidoreductase molybdopterin binding domain-containing protein [Methylobacterium phyllostachyos]|uniref:Oxidoreductase molybdopterin binding domain-containing protein n=1 Tax=Methylobacterium phyllostachyos TaxID=582672 RepID=A0A1G9WZD5_9HYPH|nr:molybdopterin-binding protein [Methylobacterium phyllostachyos]SDM89475.1 Oxidoreductase molybdopterin binding domain-containing protein [Methylobacterium phyllostachyos]
MNRPPSRRALLLGATAAAGTAMLGGCDRLGEAEWFRRTLKTGEDANLFVQRLLLTERTLAPEFPEADISPWFKPNGTEDPPDKAYKALARRKFATYHLEIDGLVETPLKLSLAELRKLPSRTQVTRHDCVEGWSAIGKWTGVPLADLLAQARLKPQARYVVFHCADTMDQGDDAGTDADDADAAPSGGNANPAMTRQTGGGEDKRDSGGQQAADAEPATEPVRYYESVDLVDAFHPQTILAYELNGKALPVANGAPLRLRVERNLGYKQAKYVMRIEVVESFANIGEGNGGYWEDQGYAWYAGI